ncbi:MAG: signal peptidase II, partial [Clostridia bacterium]|nr:signal peptidase II [Clostridia bacterium]
ILLFVDLLTKAIAFAVQVHQPDMFLGIVKLDCVMNPGIAWGVLGENPPAMVAITVLTGFMAVGIAVLFFTYFKHNTPARMALAAIEAGAIGNFIDRVYFEDGVRDFIEVDFLLPHYTCNFADMCIVLGAIALIFIILFIGKESAFPLTKKWREEAKREEALRHEKKAKKAKK